MQSEQVVANVVVLANKDRVPDGEDRLHVGARIARHAQDRDLSVRRVVDDATLCVERRIALLAGRAHRADDGEVDVALGANVRAVHH